MIEIQNLEDNIKKFIQTYKLNKYFLISTIVLNRQHIESISSINNQLSNTKLRIQQNKYQSNQMLKNQADITRIIKYSQTTINKPQNKIQTNYVQNQSQPELIKNRQNNNFQIAIGNLNNQHQIKESLKQMRYQRLPQTHLFLNSIHLQPWKEESLNQDLQELMNPSWIIFDTMNGSSNQLYQFNILD